MLSFPGGDEVVYVTKPKDSNSSKSQSMRCPVLQSLSLDRAPQENESGDGHQCKHGSTIYDMVTIVSGQRYRDTAKPAR
jgi:hypothetical protein